MTSIIIIFGSLILLSPRGFLYAQEPASLNPLVKLNTNSIGCLLPLDGEYELIGKKVLRGVLTAADVFREQIEFQIVVKDSGAGIDERRKALDEIVREDGVSFVVGPIPSTFIDGMGGTIESLRIPTLVFPVSEKGTPDNAYLIKFSYNIERQAQVLAQYAVRVIGIKTFGVLNPRNHLGEQFKEAFAKSVRALGGDLTYTGSYDLKLSDIRTEVEWVNSVHPQAIFIPDGATRSAEVLKILKQRLIPGSVLFLGPNTWNSSSFLNAIGNEVDGVVFKLLFTDFFFPGDEEWIYFRTRFEKAFGEEPGFLEYQVYEAVKLISGTLSSPIQKREEIMERLLARRDNQRFEITKTIDGGLEITPVPLILTLRNGNVIEVR